MSVGSAVAHLGTSAMPFQIGALIDGAKLSASQAGLFSLCEVGALALSMVVIAPWIGSLSARRVAWTGVALVGLAGAALSQTTLFPLLLLLGMVAGLGFGLAFAATVAAASSLDDPDRVYAAGNGGALLLLVGSMSVLPIGGRYFGPMGIFLALTAVMIVFAVLLFGFPTRPARSEGRVRGAGIPPGSVALIAVWMCFSFGNGAIWTFAERIAREQGLPSGSIVYVLSIGIFFGIAGTSLAVWFGGSANRVVALGIGLIGTGLSCLAIGYGSTLVVFAGGVIGYWIFSMFLYSYLMGTAAVFDPLGRVGTLCGGLERLAFGVGALAGGLVADHVSYPSVGALAALGSVVAMLAALPILSRALGRRSAAAATATAG
jgi:predicted MFS family arabinose efflux permease